LAFRHSFPMIRLYSVSTQFGLAGSLNKMIITGF
jgi:hypothetical protein